MDVQFDVIIIGAGPAGLTAGLYASRAGLKTAMLEAEAPGGKMIKTHLVCNYPAVDNINGADLAMQMFTHTTNYGAEYLYGDVVEIVDEGKTKKVVCRDGNEYRSYVVIIGTGTKEKTLGLEGEEQLNGKGLSYCAVCDGAFFKDKVVTVVGGGNSACEEAIYLTQFASQVNIIIRRDVFRADQHAQEEVNRNRKINIIKKHVPTQFVLENGKIAGLEIEDVDTKEKTVVDTQGLFPYIGAYPVTSFLSNLGILDEDGYVLVDESCQTKIKGIYGIGDCIVKNLRQIVTATSDGAIAAQHSVPYIQAMKEELCK